MTDYRIFKTVVLGESEERKWIAEIEGKDLFIDRFIYDHEGEYDSLESLKIPLEELVDILYSITDGTFLRQMAYYRRTNPWKIVHESGGVGCDRYHIEYLVYDNNVGAHITMKSPVVYVYRQENVHYGRIQIGMMPDGVFLPDLIEVFRYIDNLEGVDRKQYSIHDLSLLSMLVRNPDTEYRAPSQAVQLGIFTEIHKYDNIDDMKESGFNIPEGFEVEE